MKDAIAIAIAKAKLGRKKPPNNASSKSDDLASIDQELTRTTLGLMLTIGVVVGLGGLVCLVVGLIKSGGLTQFFHGLFTALGLF